MTCAITIVGPSCRSAYLREALACLKEIHSRSRKFAPLAWVLLPLRFSLPFRGEGFLVQTPREAKGATE